MIDPRENLSLAIAMATAAQSEDEARVQGDLAMLGEGIVDDPRHEAKALMGYLTLANILLLQLETATGTAPRAILENIARDYAL